MITLYSAAPNVRPLPSEEWSTTLRYEVAVLSALDVVRGDSVRVFEQPPGEGAPGFAIVTCEVMRDEPARRADSRIGPSEPVALRYELGAVGRTAPWIFSERVDFPRDLPHLNPVAENVPSSICVAREGTQALYDRGGIAEVLAALSAWLTDAAAGTLEHDGWEPVPVASTLEVCLNGRRLQENAYNSTRKGPCTLAGTGGLVVVRRDDEFQHIYAEVSGDTVSLQRLARHRERYSRIGEEAIRGEVPWVLLSGPRDATVGTRSDRGVSTVAALRRLADEAGCGDGLRYVLERWMPRLTPRFGNFLCVMVGTWRPRPLIPDVPGLAEGDPRRLDIAAFLLFVTPGEQGMGRVEWIQPMRIRATPTPDLLASISGLKQAPDDCAVIGCGALGSKLAEFLVQEGISGLALIDDDVMNPHNVARHVLGHDSVGLPKADELKRRLERLRGVGTTATGSPFSCAATVERIDRLDERGLAKAMRAGTRWVIDATADRRAAVRLVEADVDRPVMRAELSDQGAVGLLYVEGPERAPRLDDLEAALYASARDEPAVADWLRRDAALPSVMVGTGCASGTMRVPNSHVALHAGAFMPVINDRLTSETGQAGVGINRLGDAGQPTGWLWVDVPPFEVLPVEPFEGNADSWELRVHPHVLQHIEEVARERVPQEAGGYLYGRYSVTSQSITVVAGVSVEPMRSTAHELVLPPAGRSPAERALLEACGRMLPCVGSWHSHPAGTADISERDRAQARQFARANRATPRPTAMLILATTENRAYLIHPEAQ